MNQKITCLLRTIILCYLITFLLIGIGAVVLWKFRLSSSQMMPGTYALYLIPCLFGGFLAGRRIQEKRILWGVLLGLIYFIVLILLALTLTHTQAAFSGRTLITLALCLTGGLIGAVLS